MTAPAKPPVTSASIREQLEQAEVTLRQAQEALAQAAFRQLADPSIDTTLEQETADAAQCQVARLRAALPIAERAEAARLEEVRARLAADQRKRLEHGLKGLAKNAMQFSVHYQNCRSAWLRMVRSGAEAAGLLFDAQNPQLKGVFQLKLSASALRALADQEINRLGLLPALADGVSAPGTTPRAVPMTLTNAPHRLPSLEDEMRRLATVIMQSAPEPLPRNVESQGELDLPQVANEPGPAPAAPAEAPAAIPVETPALAPPRGFAHFPAAEALLTGELVAVVEEVV
jgi:hypothetical protein